MLTERIKQQSCRSLFRQGARALVLLGCVIGLAGSEWVFAQTATVDPCVTAPQSCPTLISTSATAQTRIPNTAVDISLGLSVTNASLADAQRALAEQSTTLLAFLKAQGAQRMMTTNVSVTPQTRTQKNAADKTVGYSGSTSVSFRTTPAKAPGVLAGALTHGANTIDSTTFTPTEEEMEAARRDLAAEATRTAMMQIDSVAHAVASHVIAVRAISVGSASPLEPVRAPMFEMKAMALASPAPAPIATAQGEQELSISVSVTAAVGK